MSEKQTAKRAVEILLGSSKGFRSLRAIEKVNLSAVFARKNKVLYGKAFDLVKCPSRVNFRDEENITRYVESITVYEVKSTNRKDIPEDFSGYFFDLTTAELLVAQSLGSNYRFVFVNTTNRSCVEMTIQEIFAKARKIYPKWAVRL